MKKTYRKAFTQPEEDAFYLLCYASSVDRGGASRPSKLFVADKIEDLPNPKRPSWDHSSIFKIQGGAAFRFDRSVDEEDLDLPYNEIEAEPIVKKIFDPDTSGWWSVIDEEDEDQEEDEFRKGYVIVTTNWSWKTGEFEDRRVYLTSSWSKAFGFFTGQEDYNQVDIYHVKKNEVKLVLSNAPIPESDGNTSFATYDNAFNPYKGCSMACEYCYAGEYKDYEQLPANVSGRVVIGTFTDPYQKAEAKQRRTRELLSQLACNECSNGKVTKVGIYTKSPTVVEDLDRIAALPDPHIHLSLSPFPDEWVKKIEPGSPTNAERMAAIPAIKKAGVKLIINICPCIPGLSEQAIEQFGEAYKAADEICIGLLCTYGNISDKMREILPEESVALLESKNWEIDFMNHCRTVFGPHMEEKLVIWRDRDRKGWKDLKSKSFLPQEWYSK